MESTTENTVRLSVLKYRAYYLEIRIYLDQAMKEIIETPESHDWSALKKINEISGQLIRAIEAFDQEINKR